MKGTWVLLSVALAAAGVVRAERQTVALSGSGWTADGAPVVVPHCWNIEDGTDGEGFEPEERWSKNSSCASGYERKTVVYARTLPDKVEGRRYFLRCGGASIVATVEVNGRTVGTHRGAFTAFAFEITDFLMAKGNRLRIAVDNRVQDDLPPVNADFTIYGGLYRDVDLLVTDAVCIDPVTNGANGLVVRPDPDTGAVAVDVALLGADQADVTCRVTGPGFDRTFAGTSFTVPSPVMWSPENPALYALDVTIRSGTSVDTVEERFGFRKAEFREDGFYLNGVRRRIRGVNRHQDLGGKGWALSAEDDRTDLEMIRDMGADGVRTAHYPQSRRIYDLCDELGLMAWVEQPNVNGLRFTDAFRTNVWRQAEETVAQHRNHPSVILWSIFNELYNKVHMREGEPEEMMEALRDRVRTLDPSRAIVAASDRPDRRRLNAIPDVLGFNRYPGWYQDGPMSRLVDEVCEKNGRKALSISEYGAGASLGTHGHVVNKVRPSGPHHPEEYQAFVHSEDYRSMADDPRLWGVYIWCMFDFGSDCRREGARFGVNDKGLVGFDHRTKKDAYWFYKANWTDAPVLHLVGATASEPAGPTVSVLAFSNVGKVRLEIGGRLVGELEPDAVKCCHWRDVPLEKGENLVRIQAGGEVRTATWKLNEREVGR